MDDAHVIGGLGLVQCRDPLERGASLRGLQGEAVDVGGDAFLAARGAEQLGVLRLGPIPIQAVFSKRLVERAPVRFLGVRQGPIDVQEQGLEPHANTRLARKKSHSMRSR
jgi:hypothetical protein